MRTRCVTLPDDIYAGRPLTTMTSRMRRAWSWCSVRVGRRADRITRCLPSAREACAPFLISMRCDSRYVHTHLYCAPPLLWYEPASTRIHDSVGSGGTCGAPESGSQRELGPDSLVAALRAHILERRTSPVPIHPRHLRHTATLRMYRIAAGVVSPPLDEAGCAGWRGRKTVCTNRTARHRQHRCAHTANCTQFATYACSSQNDTEDLITGRLHHDRSTVHGRSPTRSPIYARATHCPA